tara:strand:- start:2146 stop:2847 length:702 start_codon:yes stop_codon:yes gene_type:complete
MPEWFDGLMSGVSNALGFGEDADENTKKILENTNNEGSLLSTASNNGELDADGSIDGYSEESFDNSVTYDNESMTSYENSDVRPGEGTNFVNKTNPGSSLSGQTTNTDNLNLDDKIKLNDIQSDIDGDGSLLDATLENPVYGPQNLGPSGPSTSDEFVNQKFTKDQLNKPYQEKFEGPWSGEVYDEKEEEFLKQQNEHEKKKAELKGKMKQFGNAVSQIGDDMMKNPYEYKPF